MRRPGVGPAGDRVRAVAAAPAWAGTRILEFGTGAAGPIAVRYFAEHGATVIRVESRSRPDFLRTYGLGPSNPCGLEGSDMFDSVNVGKLGVTLNLKHPEGVALARRLIGWADAVAENFAPRAMRGFGLDYASLVAEKPDLVMVSSCLQGQTGPHKDYPGFGGQGSALGGYNLLTGWPDREPVGPYGTITDSLAPRFVASALAAGLLYRRRTGTGCPPRREPGRGGRVLALAVGRSTSTSTATPAVRQGNRSDRFVPHGAFPCAGRRPVRGHRLLGRRRLAPRWPASGPRRRRWPAGSARFEARRAPRRRGRGARRARGRRRATPATWPSTLQAAGVEAVPVADLGDASADPQLAPPRPLRDPGAPLHGRLRLRAQRVPPVGRRRRASTRTSAPPRRAQRDWSWARSSASAPPSGAGWPTTACSSRASDAHRQARLPANCGRCLLARSARRNCEPDE